MEKKLREEIGSSAKGTGPVIDGIEYPDPEGNYDTPHSGCAVCQNLLTIGSQTDESGWTCRAFPNGIPWALCMVAGEVSHDKPYPGDKGFRFNPKVFEYKGHKFKWKFDLTGAELVE